MDYVLFGPDVAPLLQGLKPFVPQRSGKFITGALSIIDMLSSNHGKTALQSLSDLFRPSGPKSRWGEEPQEIADSVLFGLGVAFALFLILILLVLASVFIFYDPEPDPPIDAEGPAEI